MMAKAAQLESKITIEMSAELREALAAFAAAAERISGLVNPAALANLMDKIDAASRIEADE